MESKESSMSLSDGAAWEKENPEVGSATKSKSDGSTAVYYELPPEATELQHLISYKNMNAQIGEIFRASYRYGEVEHSEMLRGAKKIKFYIEAEIERLEKLEDKVTYPDHKWVYTGFDELSQLSIYSCAKCHEIERAVHMSDILGGICPETDSTINDSRMLFNDMIKCKESK